MMVVFINRNGDQRYRGTNAEYDQVDYAGALRDYNFIQNPNGTITVTHPTLGTDTLSSIEGFWFSGEEMWYSTEDAVRLTTITTPNPPQNTIITGTVADETLRGTPQDDVFYGDRGNDTFIGRRGNDTVNYDGALSDYTISRNTDGSISITNAQWGNDTLRNIENINFTGEARSYTIAEALAATPMPPAPQLAIITGTIGDDNLRGTQQDDIFYGNRGDDTFNGRRGEDTVNYDGALSDYVVTSNADGSISITNAQWGNDTLQNIENINFTGEARSYTIAEALAATPTPPPNNGIIEGNIRDNNLTGTNGNDTFYGDRGNDNFDGRGGNDTVNYDGELVEYTITRNTNGSVTVTHPTWGTDTLQGIENLNFERSGNTFTIDQAIRQTEDALEFRLDADGVLNGTTGNDRMIGNGGDDFYYGGIGDDFYDGRGGYNQVNFDGSLADYIVTQNANGSYTFDHPVWGTDTLTNIDGLWFGGEAQWYAVDDGLLA